MPKRLPRSCGQPGCLNLSDNSYCEEHKQKKDQYRGTASERGYNARWQKARKHFLSLNPLCVECLADKYVVAATVVDHIKPHKGDYALFWDRKNWQALCKRHHDIKTATKDGGFGR